MIARDPSIDSICVVCSKDMLQMRMTSLNSVSMLKIASIVR